MSFIPVMAKLNFQQSLLLFSVSRDSLEIIIICRFGAQELCAALSFLVLKTAFIKMYTYLL